MRAGRGRVCPKCWYGRSGKRRLEWDRVTWASDRNCATQRGSVCTLLQVLVGMCRSGLVQNGQYQQYPSWLGRWVMVLRGVIRQCLRATCNRTGTGTEARGRPGRGGGCGRGVVPDAGTQARRTVPCAVVHVWCWPAAACGLVAAASSQVENRRVRWARLVMPRQCQWRSAVAGRTMLGRGCVRWDIASRRAAVPVA